ncbi:MAG: GGDEF domain-containing protein, partial [Burkholderiales bacterium PBB4]
QFQSLVLTVTPLGLLFGAFTLSAGQCRALGVVSVVMLAGGMYLSAQLNPGDSSLLRDLIIFLSCAAVYTMVASMAGRLSALRAQLREQKRHLAEALECNNLLARQDELTGLANRRHAQEMMEYEERRSAREALHPCVCLIDIDHFKAINDTYGHPAGDQVLRTVAKHAPQSLRGPDLLARWGGEEFLLVMPQTSAEVANSVTELLRAALAQPHVWAEHAHLRAKQAGRNCTVVADD